LIRWKKIIISLLILSNLFLRGCSVQKIDINIDKNILSNKSGMDITNMKNDEDIQNIYSWDIEISKTWNLIKKDVLEEVDFDIDFGEIQLASPVYSLTGKVPEWTNRV